MIHARHQYKPNRDLVFKADGFGSPWIGQWYQRTKHVGSGVHANVMPPSLRARKPWLFDGTWRNPAQRKRDEFRAHRRSIRSVNKGRMVAAELI